MTSTPQQPALPWEITDAIIDHLHDLRTLGACSLVCSEWLIRSRYHIFSTVQLWPWRVRRFFELASSSECTFTNLVMRVEVDDSRERMKAREARILNRDGQEERRKGEEVLVLFREMMAHPDIHCLTKVNSIQIQNVDWTALTPSEQTVLRGRLATFSQLKRLELHGVVFHDLREVVRIYLEHTIASATTVAVSTNLRTIELGTEDSIPVVLSCVGNPDRPQHVMGMKLQNIKTNHLQYIHTMLKKYNGLTNALDLSHLSALRTLDIEGLTISKHNQLSMVEKILPKILGRIESPFFESIELKFRLEDSADVECINWRHLEGALLALHFFGMGRVRLVCEIPSDSPTKEDRVERWIRASMSDLDERGVLDLHVVREKGVDDQTAGLFNPSFWYWFY
ncbi:hypothetical protein BDZ97DRAFT_1784109 [Flammula alnicola]|nr:hypothetical protein BDZ97DRAFT_1784109 [Flammula alnicola]